MKTWHKILIGAGIGLLLILKGREKKIRDKIIKLARSQLGVKEDPPGSNWGPEIKKYGGHAGWKWCALFVTWVWRKAGAIDFKEASTWNLWQTAKKKGWFIAKGEIDPMLLKPGTALLFQYKDAAGRWLRRGHINIILEVTDGGESFRTIGGNQPHAVTIRTDRLSNRNIVGFIDPLMEA